MNKLHKLIVSALNSEGLARDMKFQKARKLAKLLNNKIKCH